MPRLPQAPICPETDLRDMLRGYLVRRSLECMERAAERRKKAIREGAAEAYRETITAAVRGFYGTLPVGPDTEPNLYPYEAAGWGGIDRYPAYTSAALGDSVLGMRIRDGLAALTFARRDPGVDRARIIICGCGAGAVVAMHVALIGAPLLGLAVWNRPESFEALVADETPRWPHDLFMPNVLQHYGLPELLAALECTVIDLPGTEDDAPGRLVPALTRLLFDL